MSWIAGCDEPRASRVDLRTQVVDVLSIPDAQRRTTEFAALVRGVEFEQAEVFEEAIQAASIDLDEASVVLLADWWARFDPKIGIARCAGWWRQDPRVCWSAIYRAWARRDPEAARVAVEALGEENISRERQALVRGWSESGDPAGAWGYVGTLASGVGRQQLVLVLTRRMVLRDGLDATLGFAEAFPGADVDLKNQVFVRVASAVAIHDPQKAAVWAARHVDGPYGRRILDHVVSTWLHEDGEAALDWLVAQPPGAERDVAVRHAYGLWQSLEHAVAMAWVARHGKTRALRPALPVYAVALARKDPPAAVPWLEAIEDGAQRRRATMDVGRIWYARDPEAAGRWLTDAALPEDLVAEITAPPRDRKKSRKRSKN